MGWGGPHLPEATSTGPGMPVPRLHPQALLCGGTERTKHLSPIPFTMGAETQRSQAYGQGHTGALGRG